jgi:hypothetical protein
MWIMLQIFLLVLNFGMGFANIASNASPYLIALNFFASGFVAMGAIATASN